MLFFLQSCEKKKTSIPKKKSSPEVKRLLDLGNKYYQDEKFDSSYYYFNKAKSVAEIKKDTSRIIYSIGSMAYIQNDLGDHYSCEATAIEAFPFFENTDKFPYGKWSIYNLLGNNYFSALDYDNALHYYNKAYKLNTDVISNAEILSNIALVHITRHSYKKAIVILSPLILNKAIINNKYAYSHIMDNLGFAYFKIGNSSKGIALLNKSLKIRKEKNDELGLTSSYYNLSEYYKKTNPKLANYYALLAYKTTTKLNRPNDRLDCLKLLIENNSGNKSKEYALIYLNLNDSIQKVRQKAKNQFAKIKYDFKKEKEENEILKTQRVLEQEQQKNKNLLFYFIISIGLITSLFIYYYLITKNKKEKIKVSYNTEVRIAKKLHDELANDVYHTMAFAETQDLSTHSNKEKLLSNLDTIYIRTRNISKENSSINTDALFLPNLKEMMLGFSTDTVNILTNGMETIQWEEIETFKKIMVYRILQELLVNMKKHSNCNVVILSFKENENQLQINYTDNGIGVTEEQLKSKNGLKNVENRIIAIKGNSTFDTTSETGFKVNISFPI